MHWLYTLPLRFRSLLRGREVELELDDELRFHVEKKTEEFTSRGMAPEAARLAALRAMDGLTQRKEECRDARRVNLVAHFVQDVRYGIRVLAKAPGFTSAAVLTLALAIGANAVVFGILNALILRPVNVPRAESLYTIEHTNGWGYHSYPDYTDLRDRNGSFDGLAAYNIGAAGIEGSTPARAWLYEVSGNYFDVLGLRPYLGRFFHAADEHGPNSAPYIVLTYGYWHTHFQEDRNVVGRVIRLNKHPFTVLGVAPPEFRGTLLFFSPDLFIPIVNEQQVEGQSLLETRSNKWVFQVMGHLKPGVTPAQATAELNSIGSWMERTYPKEDGNMTFVLGRPGLAGNIMARPARAFVGALMLLAGLILLAACANLGSLFAARAADRAREVALRLALGASPNRVLRQLLTEAVLISIMGGAIGLWGSTVLLHGLSLWQPVPRFPMRVPVNPDASVYLVALALALVSGLLFGLAPARQVLKADPYHIVKAGASGIIGRRAPMRDLLLVVQVAICAVLVTSSMVAMRGLARSMHAEVGFEPRHAMLADIDLNLAGYSAADTPAVEKRMRDAVQALPGVQAAGLIDNPPLVEGWHTTTAYRADTVDIRPKNAAAEPVRYAIAPEYFEAAGTRLLAGRNLSPHDDGNAPLVAIVNPLFAVKVFGSVDKAVGAHYKGGDGKRIQVVGIVQQGKYTTNIAETAQPAVFVPLRQRPQGHVWIVVRSERDPQQLGPAIRAALLAQDRDLPVFLETWEAGMNGAMFATRVATVSLAVMGTLGAVLAITGIFGMAAYSVSKRLREIGIRIALGAKRKEVLETALGRALRLLALGSAAGLLLGVLAARVLGAIVYQASPRDPVVLAGAILSMALLGLAATWIPAHRALSLDPVTLLREE